MSEPSKQLYELAAERASSRPEYLGWILRRHMELEGVGWEDLAGHLGTDTTFASLALCLRPRKDHFAADVRAISIRFGVDHTILAAIIRSGEAAEVLQAQELNRSDGAGALLAARSRKDEEDGTEPEA